VADVDMIHITVVYHQLTPRVHPSFKGSHRDSQSDWFAVSVVMITLHRSGLSIAVELRMLSLSRLCFLYRAHQKSKPLGKIRYLCNCRKFLCQIYDAYWV